MTEPITYTLLDPTGNMTLLAETPVPEKTQPLIARKLMELTRSVSGWQAESSAGMLP